MEILNSINTPADIKGLSVNELEQLAGELRQKIIEVVSINGGHLASSLGCVELCIALHYIYNTPVDEIFWDVSHQTYAHKLLTGRRDRFHTLRMTDGISGFNKPEENPYDTFVAGHASTSIAAALGSAIARDLKGEQHNVIAVIGDGAMTGGLAFEALNNLGQLGTDLLIIVNDNEMSIGRNVGAITRIFTRLITHNFYNIAKEDMEDFIKRFARSFGQRLVKFTQRVEESLKGLIVPGIFFEEMGIRYIGPVDGNNLGELISTIKNIRNLRGPRLLHIFTKKGKGYPPAEENPEKFHSAPPFVIETGETAKKSLSYTKVFGSTLCDLAERDERIVAITPAMAAGTGITEFAEKFHERFFDVGIAEQCAVTMAAGMARKGMRPVAAIYSTFLQRALDQVIHDVALQNLPVVFALDRAGIVGEDGPTHHGVFDLSYLRMVPNMTIMAPANGRELRKMLYTALTHEAPGPITIRYPRGAVPDDYSIDSPPELERIPWGKAVTVREGKDGIILALGRMVDTALKTAEDLASDGLDIAVCNLRFVKPLDRDYLLRVATTYPLIFSLEDNVLAGGAGSAINELFKAEGLESICRSFGFPDTFLIQGSPEDIFEKYGLDAAHVAQKIREVFPKKESEKKSESSTRSPIHSTHQKNQRKEK